MADARASAPGAAAWRSACVVRRSCCEAPVHSHLPWPGYAVRFCCSASKRLLVSRKTVLEDFPMPMPPLRMPAAS